MKKWGGGKWSTQLVPATHLSAQMWTQMRTQIADPNFMDPNVAPNVDPTRGPKPWTHCADPNRGPKSGPPRSHLLMVEIWVHDLGPRLGPRLGPPNESTQCVHPMRPPNLSPDPMPLATAAGEAAAAAAAAAGCWLRR